MSHVAHLLIGVHNSYRKDLKAWVSRVENQSTFKKAFREAEDMPQPPRMMKAFMPETSDVRWARDDVRDILEEKVSLISSDDPDFPEIMEKCQAKWPEIHDLLKESHVNDHDMDLQF